MAENISEVSSRIRASLALTEPDLDTGVGTPVRKIIDAFSEIISEVSAESFLIQYEYDIDSKTGDDLDNFVSLFGFTRYGARRSSGALTFQRDTPFTADIFIPAGTQVTTSTLPLVVCQTLVPAIMPIGETSIDVPAQTIVQGSFANVPAASFTVFITGVNGIQAVTNASAFTGGTDAESDGDLRLRFKRTVFRSIAGTEDMYLAVALENENVSRANVVGAQKTYREQIELIGDPPTGVSSAADVQYAYPDSSFFGTDIDSDDGIVKRDVFYDFDAGVTTAPGITSANDTVVPEGIYELQYDYVSTASRNDPAEGITNRIDVWVAGTDPTSATEDILWDGTKLFSVLDTNPLWRDLFLRDDLATKPTAGNIFVPLTFGPLISVPDIIVIDAQTFEEGTDYWVVNQIGAFGWSARSMFGIEFLSTANGQAKTLPDDGDLLMIEGYVYNDVPTQVEIALRQWRLVTTDVRAHQAVQMRLRFNIVVMYNENASIAAVNTEINANLNAFVQSVGFNEALQVSDALNVISNTPGVDAVRFTVEGEVPGHFAIEWVEDDGITVIERWEDGGTPGRAIDIVFGDDEVPIFGTVNIVRRAQNTFNQIIIP